MFRSRFIVVLLLYTCSTATAGEVSYNCEVQHVYNLEHDGTLIPSDSEWSKHFIGEFFTVSRVTGEIIGDVVPTLLTTSTRIINKGSKDWAFRAVADFEDAYQLIEIQEFRVSETKPFLASSMGGAGIVTGLCQ